MESKQLHFSNGYISKSDYRIKKTFVRTLLMLFGKILLDTIFKHKCKVVGMENWKGILRRAYSKIPNVGLPLKYVIEVCTVSMLRLNLY